MTRFLIVGMTLFSFGGCDLPPLPKEIYIEGRFSDMEIAVIEDMINGANDFMRPCLGNDGLEYKGLIDDADGFRPYSFGDDFHVVYTLDEESEEYSWLSCTTDRGFGGYATLQDVLMITTLDAIPGIDAEIAEIEGDPDFDSDPSLWERLDRLIERRESNIDHFRHIILHEFGHHIGLTHNPEADALMNADSDDDILDFQEADRDAFAYVRGCRYPE